MHAGVRRTSGGRSNRKHTMVVGPECCLAEWFCMLRRVRANIALEPTGLYRRSIAAWFGQRGWFLLGRFRVSHPAAQLCRYGATRSCGAP